MSVDESVVAAILRVVEDSRDLGFDLVHVVPFRALEDATKFPAGWGELPKWEAHVYHIDLRGGKGYAEDFDATLKELSVFREASVQ